MKKSLISLFVLPRLSQELVKKKKNTGRKLLYRTVVAEWYLGVFLETNAHCIPSTSWSGLCISKLIFF